MNMGTNMNEGTELFLNSLNFVLPSSEPMSTAEVTEKTQAQAASTLPHFYIPGADKVIHPQPGGLTVLLSR